MNEVVSAAPWPNPAGSTTAVAGTANYAIYATNAPPNLAPVVNAGSNLSTSTGSATLNGTVADDGVPAAPGAVTSVWTKVSGPGTVAFGNASSTSTTATFSAIGAYVLRLTAQDALSTASDDIAIDSTMTPYGAWLAGTFTPAQLADASISGPAADFDGDSLNTLLEYALNTSPLVASTAALPAVARNGQGLLTLTFLRARPELTYQVEGSSDLSAWSVIPGIPGAAGQYETVTDNATTTPRFLQLRVSQ